MASALLRLAARSRRGARDALAAARCAAAAPAARGFATDGQPSPAAPHAAPAHAPSKYGPSASWITAGMLLRMRRPRAAHALGGRWAEGCLTVRTNDSVADAVRLMAAHEVGCLAVTDPAVEHVAGLLTERQYSRNIVLEGRSSDTTRVAEVMSTRLVCVNVEEKLDVIADVLSVHRIRHLPVVGGTEMEGAPGQDHILRLPAPVTALRGVLSVKDVAWMLFCLVRNELQGHGIGSITVRDMMSRMPLPPQEEGRQHLPPFSIHQDRSVLDAIREMARLGSHALVVVDDAGALCGIITERDYIQKLKVVGRTSEDTPVSEVMTSTPWCASLDFTLDDVLTVMTKYGFRHMPIVGAVGEPGQAAARPPDDGGHAPLRPRCLGLLSVVDVMRTITEWPDRPIAWPDNRPPLPGPL